MLEIVGFIMHTVGAIPPVSPVDHYRDTTAAPCTILLPSKQALVIGFLCPSRASTMPPSRSPSVTPVTPTIPRTAGPVQRRSASVSARHWPRAVPPIGIVHD